MKMTLTRGASVLVAALLLAAAAHAAGLLTAKNGMTLYVYDKDKGGVSSCYGFCADFWPPYLAKKGEKAIKDGKLQWAYGGRPLYFYAVDKKKGDKAGDGKNGVWHVVKE
jgi:predicted lipoprotein with Yx(FWY)xxD motif